MNAKPLDQQTPAEIDSRLAELYLAEARTEKDAESAAVTARHALGERPTFTSKGKRTWPTNDADAIAKAREIADPTAYEFTAAGRAHQAVAKHDAAIAQRATIAAEQDVLHAEFTRRGGWSRFFTVQQSDGHIHSSMRCSTCNRNGQRTLFGWNAGLSGLTEADAVAKLGPSLCTVCFPSAPVEWTVGKQETVDDSKCINRTGVNYRRRGVSLSGDCGTCGARGVAATEAGGLRKHPHHAKAVEAERTARREDPKLIGTPEGDVLKVDGVTLKTVRSAEIAYVDELWWVAKGNPANRAEHEANARTLAEALAAKAGVTAEEIAEKFAARVARKLREN